MYSSFPFEVVIYSTGMTKQLYELATKIGATFCVINPASLNELAKVLIQICIDINNAF